MKTGKSIFLIILIGFMATLFWGCALFGSNAADGTVTVTLSNATSANSDYLYAYVYAEDETDVNNPATVLATESFQITSGAAVITLEIFLDDGNWGSNGTTWTGTGGTTYDIYIYTTDNGNDPDSDVDAKQTVTFPLPVTIDDNQTINIDFGDMITYVGP